MTETWVNKLPKNTGSFLFFQLFRWASWPTRSWKIPNWWTCQSKSFRTW